MSSAAAAKVSLPASEGVEEEVARKVANGEVVVVKEGENPPGFISLG